MNLMYFHRHQFRSGIEAIRWALDSLLPETFSGQFHCC
jgi:hypothetical protein